MDIVSSCTTWDGRLRKLCVVLIGLSALHHQSIKLPSKSASNWKKDRISGCTNAAVASLLLLLAWAMHGSRRLDDMTVLLCQLRWLPYRNNVPQLAGRASESEKVHTNDRDCPHNWNRPSAQAESKARYQMAAKESIVTFFNSYAYRKSIIIRSYLNGKMFFQNWKNVWKKQSISSVHKLLRNIFTFNYKVELTSKYAVNYCNTLIRINAIHVHSYELNLNSIVSKNICKKKEIRICILICPTCSSSHYHL